MCPLKAIPHILSYFFDMRSLKAFTHTHTHTYSHTHTLSLFINISPLKAFPHILILLSSDSPSQSILTHIRTQTFPHIFSSDVPSQSYKYHTHTQEHTHTSSRSLPLSTWALSKHSHISSLFLSSYVLYYCIPTHCLNFIRCALS